MTDSALPTSIRLTADLRDRVDQRAGEIGRGRNDTLVELVKWGLDNPPGDDAHRAMVVPHLVYRRLLAGFIRGEGAWILREPGLARGRWIHSGDAFGEVLAWVWNQDRDAAMVVLADLTAFLRESPAAIEPKLRLDDLLDGLRLALPSHFGPQQRAELVEMARDQVPRYYGSDPNN